MTQLQIISGFCFWIVFDHKLDGYWSKKTAAQLRDFTKKRRCFSVLPQPSIDITDNLIFITTLLFDFLTHQTTLYINVFGQEKFFPFVKDVTLRK